MAFSVIAVTKDSKMGYLPIFPFDRRWDKDGKLQLPVPEAHPIK
jgi:chloramphenicol O-acetyltransferase